jgi:hypothetical protein
MKSVIEQMSAFDNTLCTVTVKYCGDLNRKIYSFLSISSTGLMILKVRKETELKFCRIMAVPTLL